MLAGQSDRSLMTQLAGARRSTGRKRSQGRGQGMRTDAS